MVSDLSADLRPPDPTLRRGPEPARIGNIRVGTASWTEKTLLASGAFYPASVTSAADRLRFYARHFPVVEVDSSFYSLPSKAVVTAWVERTPIDFAFGIKAFASMTQHPFAVTRLPRDLRDSLPESMRDQEHVYPSHVDDAVLEEIWQRFGDAIAPLKTSGKLGYVLFQMPKWFVASRASAAFLERLPARLPGCPIAVEFREQGWLGERLHDRTLALLRRNDLIYTCVDEPQGTRASVPPIAAVTSPRLAVVRFHGRRGDMWVKPGATTNERFGYRYSQDELRSWLSGIGKLASDAHEVHVLMNNCYRDSAVHNAKDLAELLAAMAKGDD